MSVSMSSVHLKLIFISNAHESLRDTPRLNEETDWTNWGY